MLSLPKANTPTERIFMFLHLGIMVAFIELAPFFSATSDNEGIAITTGTYLCSTYSQHIVHIDPNERDLT